MKKYLIIIISFLCSIQSWGQIEYNAIKLEADNWYASVTNTDATTSLTNPKTIEFPDYNYCITGIFKKGQLCEGEIAEFYDTSDAMPQLILRGTVQYIANRTTIKGIMYKNSEYGICCTYGTFIVSNSPDHHMIYKAKKSGQLSITCSDAEYYMGHICNCLTAVRIKGQSGIAMYGAKMKNSYNDYYSPLSEELIILYGYTDLANLLISSGNNARLHWSQGRHRDFKGTVFCEIKADKTLNFILLDGEKSGSSNSHKSIKVYEDGSKLCMELFDTPGSQIKKEIIIVPDKNLIDIHSYWDIKAYLSNMSEIRWYLRNGDSFIGNATYEVKTSNDGKSETIREQLTTGIYTYANGDYFEGDMSQGFYCGFPVSGTIHFKDGSSVDGNWLKEYNLTESQYQHISTLRYPSEARNSALAFYNDNLYQRYIEEAQTAKEQMRYQEAKELYLAAKALRPDAEPWDEILAEIEELLVEDSFRQEMIQKYGDHYGSMIAEGNIEIGMSKSMVVDAFSTDPVLSIIYKVSNMTDSSNKVHEIWEYDFNQFERYIRESEGAEEIAYKVLNKLGSSIGLDLRREFDRVVKYKYLDFKDDVLVDLKVNQRSEVEDELHEAMWLWNMVSRFF